MTYKLDEIKRLQDVRDETARARTELREQLEILNARFNATLLGDHRDLAPTFTMRCASWLEKTSVPVHHATSGR